MIGENKSSTKQNKNIQQPEQLHIYLLRGHVHQHWTAGGTLAQKLRDGTLGKSQRKLGWSFTSWTKKEDFYGFLDIAMTGRPFSSHPYSPLFKNSNLGTFLLVLGLWASTVGNMDSIPGQGTKIPNTAQPSQKKKNPTNIQHVNCQQEVWWGQKSWLSCLRLINNSCFLSKGGT